jgi:hypothetical protein
MKETLKLAQLAAGRIRLGYVKRGEWRFPHPWQRNALIVDAPVIMAMLLRGEPDGKLYHIGGMYIEFADTTVSPATIDPTAGLSYYNNLYSGSGGAQDYLRVSLTSTSGSNSDESRYSGDNVATFQAQTAGSLGVHGKSFTTGKYVYGGALVANLDPNDSSQDLIWARFMYPTAQQLAKIAGSQIGLTWEYPFTE